MEPQISHPKQQIKQSPEENANFLSILTFGWITPLFKLGYKRPLQFEDLYPPTSILNTNFTVGNFEQYWNEELNISKEDPSYTPNIQKVLFKLYKKKMLLIGFISLLAVIATLLNPLVLSFLIDFVALSHTQETYLSQGFIYILSLFFLTAFSTYITNYCQQKVLIMAIQTNSAIAALIYRKSLRLSSAARIDFNSGKVINVVSTDCQRIQQMITTANNLWIAPIQIIATIVMMCYSIGYSALPGIAVILIVTPFNGALFNQVKKIRRTVAPITDRRVKLMGEVLAGIRVIKFFSWESSFLEKIESIRNLELKQIFKRALFFAAFGSIVFAIPIIGSSISFIVFSLQGPLDAAKIFPVLTWFQQLRFPLMILPNLLLSIAEYKIAINRVTSLLLTDEVEKQPDYVKDSDFAIQVTNGEFIWETSEIDKKAVPLKKLSKEKSDATIVDTSKEEKINIEDEPKKEINHLRNINFKIKHGSLVAIVGRVGSGKSSLLNALIGEMKKISGDVKISGKLSYAPQQAFIQNCSLKENILFGQEYQKDRYLKTISDCALERDLEILPDGDSTEIGEKGINLSGGQKLRVNLARCVYYNSDIVLMDDPLSAVDSHVGKYLFETCIQENLKGKTRILVTHQLHFLSAADHIIYLSDGEIKEQGAYQELLENGGEFCNLMTSYGGVEESSTTSETETDVVIDEKKVLIEDKKEMLNFMNQIKTNELMSKEERNVGNVKFSIYLAWMKAAGGTVTMTFLGLILIFSTGMDLGQNFWLTLWSEKKFPFLSLNNYIIIFCAWGIANILTTFSTNLVFAVLSVRATRKLHYLASHRIFRSPVSFFDSTPLGRIMNRFSRDQDSVDNSLSDVLRMFCNTTLRAISYFFLIIYATPYFIIALIPLLCIYYVMQKVYRATSRELKRLDSIMRSPFYSHFGESLQGIATIRAYKEQSRFIAVLDERLNNTNSPYYLLVTSSQWLSVRLQLIGAFLVFFASLCGVLSRYTISAAVFGLAISYALQVTQTLFWCVNQFVNTEIAMNAVERIDYYGTKIEVEADFHKNTPAPPNWPRTGLIKFENVDVRYKPELPLVLKNVTFSIEDKEKIAIVGRTGSGKSTLMNSLFRIMEASSGKIIIDGIDISQIGLLELRKGLSIIPQDPILFSGTFRTNLDPFNEHDENQLWDCLARANLKEKVIESGGLDSVVQEGGDNLSVGQKQLICLARSMLKRPRILVMDEATANVDYETDTFIQKALREDFKDATILTIAHRLNTIIDYDKVLVFEAGELVEIGSPSELLEKPSGIFLGMVEETGSVNAELLKNTVFDKI
ncbi:hypothetical protein HDU92_006863 [Lobulomyces angularis]|nr:hypothetical protein HDU92_006863 [Lobulomyces angularis]